MVFLISLRLCLGPIDTSCGGAEFLPALLSSAEMLLRKSPLLSLPRVLLSAPLASHIRTPHPRRPLATLLIYNSEPILLCLGSSHPEYTNAEPLQERRTQTPSSYHISPDLYETSSPFPIVKKCLSVCVRSPIPPREGRNQHIRENNDPCDAQQSLINKLKNQPYISLCRYNCFLALSPFLLSAL